MCKGVLHKNISITVLQVIEISPKIKNTPFTENTDQYRHIHLDQPS